MAAPTPPRPNPYRWPPFATYPPPSSRGPGEDGSFDYLALVGADGEGGGGGGGGSATATSAEVLADGRLLVVTFEMDTPADFGAPDWLPGKRAGATCSLSTGARLRFYAGACASNVPSFGAATWTSATKTLVKAGAFTNYVWKSGDQIGMLSGTVGPELSLIASKDSNDQITLTAASSGADSSSIVCLEMAAGQGTKLVWRVSFLVDDPAQVVTYDVTGLTFSASAGLVQDSYGNSSRAVAGLAVTNSSLVDADGFTTDFGFALSGTGVRVYVAPGFGNDSNTVAQAQNMATPWATLNKAMTTLQGATYNNFGNQILLLQGTTHQLTAQGKLWVNGQDRLHPYLIGTYWDPGAGVGAQGVRPVVSYPSAQTIVSGGGGASLATSNWIVIRGIEFSGVQTWPNATIARSSRITFDDCVFNGGAHGIDFQYDFSATVVSAAPMMTYVTMLRCLIKDVWSPSAGHTQGIYVANCNETLISQCQFDRTGLVSADGSASDTFSRAMYIDAENGRAYVWGTWCSRSDGFQNRPGGVLADCVFSEVQVDNFIGGGSWRRTYTEWGANFGSAAFSGATYTQGTLTLAATGIGTGVSATSSVYVVTSSTGVVGQFRVASATANAVVLVSPGMGADATAVGGSAWTTPRGFGPASIYVLDCNVAAPQLIELNCVAYVNKYGGDPRLSEISAPSSAQARAPRQIIVRNNTGRQSGPLLLSKQASSPMAPLVRAQNLVDNRGTSQNVENDATITDWSFFQSDNNAFLSNAASPFSSSGSKNLAQYRTLTGQEAASINSGTPVYVNDGADLGAWAGQCGLTPTVAALVTAIRARAWNTWPSYVVMPDCVTFMFGQYQVASGLPAVGTAPLTFYGCGVTDPAVYGS